ncbi:MAG: helix-turn-helix transcriptional regulator, partial [Ruminococcus sp.]|nr:helix-turn-helix transcriptional regulator [Ruminococcus sp.]
HSYKKCFGVSFHKDRINARLAKTKQLLLTTELNTTQIAEICGYSDSKYFLHQFSKETGMTPISYRKAFLG